MSNYKQIIWNELLIWQEAYPQNKKLLKKFVQKIKLEIELQGALSYTNQDSQEKQVKQVPCGCLTSSESETSPDNLDASQDETKEVLNDNDAMESINKHKARKGEHSDYSPASDLDQDISEPKGCGKEYKTIEGFKICSGAEIMCNDCKEKYLFPDPSENVIAMAEGFTDSNGSFHVEKVKDLTQNKKNICTCTKNGDDCSECQEPDKPAPQRKHSVQNDNLTVEEQGEIERNIAKTPVEKESKKELHKDYGK